MEGVFSKELLSLLEEWLDSYGHVFLIPAENGTVGTFVSSVLQVGAERAKKKKEAGKCRMLVLSTVPSGDISEFIWQQITEEEEEQLLRLYQMYEFSDHFSVIAQEGMYGGLFNLIKTGLLTMEEAAQALFS